MATAPFVLVTSTPGDTDITSQFPALDRGDKDKIQSWILTDHNVDGTHTQSSYVQVGTLLSDGTTTTVAPSPANNRTAVYRDSDGSLKAKRGEDSTIEFLSTPPGAVLMYGGSTAPQGWLLCFGQSLATATYPRLFTAIGYTFGGAGANFNIPDLRGRYVVGLGNMGGSDAGRVTAGGGNYNSSILGNAGGSQSMTLTGTNLPGHSHNYNGTTGGSTSGNDSPDHTHNINTQQVNVQGAGGTPVFQWTGGGLATAGASVRHQHSIPGLSYSGTTDNGNGLSGTGFGLVTPSIVLTYIIRY